MLNFSFCNPTRIEFGENKIEALDHLIPQSAKVLMLYGGGSIKRFGTYDKIKKTLGQRQIIDFGGIEANPRFETLMKAVKIVKEEKVDFLLAVGGGSVIDGTKFVNLAAHYDGDNPQDLLTGSAVKSVSQVLPMGTVLTLPATGSEMNGGAVISYEDGKFPVTSPLSFPKFSVLDPKLTMSLPTTQVANGIVDTFIHVLEQYATYPVDARFQDRAAEGILQTLIEIGPKTLKDPEDYDARANLMWCATMGLNGLIGAGVPQDWSTHMIGHEITALFGIDHGKTLAVILPALWKVRFDQKKDKLLQYGQRIWNIQSDDKDEAVRLAIKKTEDFFKSLGMGVRLSDYGIKKDDLKKILDGLENHGMTRLSETKDLTLDQVEKILNEAL